MCKEEHQHRGPGQTQAPVWMELDNSNYLSKHVFHHYLPPIPSPYLSSLPFFFFHYYFHHLCLSRNYYKLISCKWSHLQTREGLVLGAKQLLLTCTLPMLLLRHGIDRQEIKTTPWANVGHKNHVPVTLSSAKGHYQSNSHICGKQACWVTSIFSFSRYLLCHVHHAKPVILTA